MVWIKKTLILRSSTSLELDILFSFVRRAERECGVQIGIPELLGACIISGTLPIKPESSSVSVLISD
jgi:hypothetical protein